MALYDDNTCAQLFAATSLALTKVYIPASTFKIAKQSSPRNGVADDAEKPPPWYGKQYKPPPGIAIQLRSAVQVSVLLPCLAKRCRSGRAKRT